MLTCGISDKITHAAEISFFFELVGVLSLLQLAIGGSAIIFEATPLFWLATEPESLEFSCSVAAVLLGLLFCLSNCLMNE